MVDWIRWLVYGVLAWAIGAVLALLAGNVGAAWPELERGATALLTVLVTVVLGGRLLRAMAIPSARQALLIGFGWMLLAIALDGVLGGASELVAGSGDAIAVAAIQYVFERGIDYLSMPLVLWGLASMRDRPFAD